MTKSSDRANLDAPVGDVTDRKAKFSGAYHHPAAGWGAAKSVTEFLIRENEVLGAGLAMLKMNQHKNGFDCPGCAWPDDLHGIKLDVCENGMKHLAWEMTHRRVTPAFFAKHSVTELSSWSEYSLEKAGRLTEPMRYDAATDHYVPISWAEAFETIGRHLRGLDSPHQASFYTSGRLGNEATFLYQLFVREFGTNNLPDCSNMCHEASGRALMASIGTGKGTVDLHDWEEADALFILGVNVSSNAPRMLTSLVEAYERGAQIVHVNPLVEAGAGKALIPHDFVKMATFKSTPTSTMNIQPRVGGDMALLRGMAKTLFEWAETDPTVLDTAFIEQHTSGIEHYKAACEAVTWAQLEGQSGLSREVITEAARIYRESKRCIISWCLGITQHDHGVDTIREISNLLLMRGNIGRPGAGPSPVRGHSNVQGNRTCGIDHRPAPAFLDRLAEVCGIDPPREHGLDTITTLEGMQRGEVKVFIALGGNFALAVPDSAYSFAALEKCDLSVHVSTKLNRSHLVHGKEALILPCLGRTEKDMQAEGIQGTTVEDAMSIVHISVGAKKPASPHLLSEPAIIAGMAQATLPDSKTPWAGYVANYDRIRDTMERVLPGFENFNDRVHNGVGFRIDQPARELDFRTETGKAEFSAAALNNVIPEAGILALGTMRSHDQWNTTIYSDNDRYRGVKNLRTLIFMNPDDMAERGISEFDKVEIVSIARDGSTRELHEYTALPYNIPRGCAAGYMPEMNVLCAIGDYSKQSDQPIMKHVNVRVRRM